MEVISRSVPPPLGHPTLGEVIQLPQLTLASCLGPTMFSFLCLIFSQSRRYYRVIFLASVALHPEIIFLTAPTYFIFEPDYSIPTSVLIHSLLIGAINADLLYHHHLRKLLNAFSVVREAICPLPGSNPPRLLVRRKGRIFHILSRSLGHNGRPIHISSLNLHECAANPRASHCVAG